MIIILGLLKFVQLQQNNQNPEETNYKVSITFANEKNVNKCMTCNKPRGSIPNKPRSFVCNDCNKLVFLADDNEQIKYCNIHKIFHQFTEELFEFHSDAINCKNAKAVRRSYYKSKK